MHNKNACQQIYSIYKKNKYFPSSEKIRESTKKTGLWNVLHSYCPLWPYYAVLRVQVLLVEYVLGYHWGLLREMYVHLLMTSDVERSNTQDEESLTGISSAANAAADDHTTDDYINKKKLFHEKESIEDLKKSIKLHRFNY